MLAHNENGLDIGDLCVVEHETGIRTPDSRTPKAFPPGTDTPTHKVIWLKQAVGCWRSIVALEELPKEEVSTDKNIGNLYWILIGCVVVLVISALLAPPPIP